jgi:hypothetical protein
MSRTVLLVGIASRMFLLITAALQSLVSKNLLRNQVPVLLYFLHYLQKWFAIMSLRDLMLRRAWSDMIIMTFLHGET